MTHTLLSDKFDPNIGLGFDNIFAIPSSGFDIFLLFDSFPYQIGGGGTDCNGGQEEEEERLVS